MDRIKESFDSLPIAVCFFDKNGVVRLINHRMLAVASQLRKGGIQTLAELHDALRSPPPTVRCLDSQLYIFRFSDGTELYVRFQPMCGRTDVFLTNNGAAPKEKITEGGGLSMLRHHVEEAGGRMEIQSLPRFSLMLSLPEKEETAHESGDR